MILYLFKNKYYSTVVVTFGQWLFGTDIIKPIFPTLPSCIYRKEKQQAWRNLVNAINTWNQTHGTGVTCSAKSIKTLRVSNIVEKLYI